MTPKVIKIFATWVPMKDEARNSPVYATVPKQHEISMVVMKNTFFIDWLP